MTATLHSATSHVSVDVLGELINLAGRQRMLSQRIVLQLVLAAQGDDSAATIAQTCLATFRSAHDALANGKSGDARQPGAFSPALQDLYFGQAKADARVRAFIELASHALDDVRAGCAPVATSGEGSLAALVGHATPLLELLQTITNAYQQEMHRCEVAQQKRQAKFAEQLSGISMQANIVALNARISAARAGQHGREFAVITTVLADIIKEMDQLIRQVVSDAEGDGETSVAPAAAPSRAAGQPMAATASASRASTSSVSSIAPRPAVAASPSRPAVAASPSRTPAAAATVSSHPSYVSSSPLSRTQSLMHKGVQ